MRTRLLLWSGFRITWKQPCVMCHRKDKKHPLPFYTTAPLYKRRSKDSQTSFRPCSEDELFSIGIRLKAWMLWSLLRYRLIITSLAGLVSSLGFAKIAFQQNFSYSVFRWISEENVCFCRRTLSFLNRTGKFAKMISIIWIHIDKWKGNQSHWFSTSQSVESWPEHRMGFFANSLSSFAVAELIRWRIESASVLLTKKIHFGFSPLVK